MAKRIAGTPRKVQLNGVPFSVAFDADLEEAVSNFENTVIASSGSPMISQEAKVPTVSDLPLLVDAGEKDMLRGWNDSGDVITFMYTSRAGDKYRSQGTFNIESNKTKENRMTITLLPLKPWTIIIA